MSNNLFQEIPEDEIELGKDEILVPVAHFNKVKRVSFFPCILRTSTCLKAWCHLPNLSEFFFFLRNFLLPAGNLSNIWNSVLDQNYRRKYYCFLFVSNSENFEIHGVRYLSRNY